MCFFNAYAICGVCSHIYAMADVAFCQSQNTTQEHCIIIKWGGLWVFYIYIIYIVECTYTAKEKIRDHCKFSFHQHTHTVPIIIFRKKVQYIWNGSLFSPLLYMHESELLKWIWIIFYHLLSKQWSEWIRKDRSCQAHRPLSEFHVSGQEW